MPTDDTDVERVVAALAGQVEALKGRVGDIAGLVDVGAPSGRQVTDWMSLSTDDAAARLLRLADWIEGVLVDGYYVTRRQLPDCWALHRPAVIHLLWLEDTYSAAYGEEAIPLAAAEWNTRWRPAGLELLREVVPTRLCRPRANDENGRPQEGVHMMTEEEQQRLQAPPPPPPPPPIPAGAREAAERSRLSFPATAPPRRSAPQRTDASDPVIDPQVAAQTAERKFWQGYLDQAFPLDADWRATRQRRAAQRQGAAELTD